MYKCEGCEIQSRPRQHLFLTTVAIRKKVYFDNSKRSSGFEIVKQMKLCGRCSKRVDTPVVV